ncbi:DNA-3-methyladenine glycosylase I [Kingella negevensis]|uniref:DNA-3-methyladenine glycosylase I n=1 Tax=Kingella negevensis TaxID=1522312 RepID=UPI00254CEB63|nr:DNA-3-methyladenine glycosylase I [Kingella negevensis]MDK4680806.1 DNA-3-methyladenine glycosylase I [Kingella negevensis]MDK4681471.1 DNA-3-methyladenine glycosylase I [Kingella negevensis]MDK4691858.1 DNA-3-methyladenine glycosylase I [Kingella negevensis]MDK4692989.1 DNA-3-methyladenine glycosylase I [Kingella negevensis]MDK4699288.1 DNA-3-methyladenine glycosylase I [Kingella negevensis]
MSYCTFCAELPNNTDNPNKAYHDTEYGVPQSDDNILFERLILEINQAGLSWTTILKKRAHFQAAYAQFDIAKIAAFDEHDIARLLNDTGIIRNRLKIQAAIYNAQQILRLQQEYGSFKAWLDAHHPREKVDWVKLFKKQFKFVGSEIVGEFLMSLNYLSGAHDVDCPFFRQPENMVD